MTRHELAKKIDEHAGALARSESGGVISQYVIDEVEKLASSIGIPVPDEATAIGFIQKYSDGAVDKRQKGGDTRPKGVDLAPVEIKVKPTAKAEIKKMGDDTMKEFMKDPKLSGKEFTDYRNGKGMSTAQIAEATGIPKATIQGYACGKPTPVAKYNQIMKAIEDFKPGEQPAKPAKKSTPSSKKGTGAKPDPESAKILRDMRDSTGITVKQVSKETGIGKSSIQNYLAGTHPIPDDKFSAIVKAFDTLKPEGKPKTPKDSDKAADKPTKAISKAKAGKKAEPSKKTATTPAKRVIAPDPETKAGPGIKPTAAGLNFMRIIEDIPVQIKYIQDALRLMLVQTMEDRRKGDANTDRARALETLNKLIEKSDCIPAPIFERLLAAYESTVLLEVE